MRDLQDRLKLALALFVAAFLSYAFAQDYVPTTFGVMGRTCYLGALCAGVLWASLILEFHKVVGYVVLAMVLVLFAVSNNTATIAYSQVFYMENQTLNQIQDAMRQWPKTRQYTITPVALRYGAGNLAEGFVAQWDFNSAIHVASGRPDIKGVVVIKQPHKAKKKK